MLQVHPRDILCSHLARKQAERTRFGELHTIHASDLVSRADFVYFERVGAPVPICGHLARMYTGFMWEREIQDAMARRGYVHEPEYSASIIAELRYPDGTRDRREFLLLSHPDFVLNPTRPEHIVEMKSTRWAPDEIERILRGQFSTLANFDYIIEDVFDPDTYEVKIPAFWNWLFQLAVYRWYHGWRRRVPCTLLVVYRNDVREIQVPERVLRSVLEKPISGEGSASTFDSRLSLIITALELARRGYNPLHPIALAVLEHVHILGFIGYIANESRLVLEEYTLPYMKLTNYEYERDAWIFAAWQSALGLPRRPLLMHEPIPQVPENVCERIRRKYHRSIERMCSSSVLEHQRWCALIRHCIMPPTLAKAELYAFYREHFFPFVARVAQVLIQRLNIPAVRIIKKESIGVSRSPLTVTDEAIEQKLARVEELLRRTREHVSEPGFTT